MNHLTKALLSTVTLVALSACGADAPAANAADRDFAEQMIVHHEQALEMSALVADASASPAVVELGAEIADAQGPEITRIQGWLDDWDADHAGHGDDPDPTLEHGGHGMMSPEQMTALENASGADFDRLWLRAMIEHHEGAITMAQAVITDGEHPDVRALAEQIVADQQAEIDQMRGLLDE